MKHRSAINARRRSALRPFLLALAFAAVAPSARAQDHVYTWMDGTGFWDDLGGGFMPGNWTTDPMGLGAFRIGLDPMGAHDRVTIRVGTFTGTRLLCDVGLRIEGGGLTLTGGDPSTVGGDLVVVDGAFEAAGEVDVSGDLVLGGGVVTATALNVAGGFVWSGGALGSGGTVNVGDATFGTADGQVLTNAGTLDVAGAARWDAYGTDLENWGGTVHVAAGGSILFANTGVVTGYDADDIGLGAGIVGGALVNDGTLTVAADNYPEDESHVSIGVESLRNNGTIDVTADFQGLDLYGANEFANAGFVRMGYGSYVQMGTNAGDAVNSGLIAIDGNGTQALLYSNLGSVLNSGTIRVTSDPDDFDNSRLTITSGVGVSNTGVIAVSHGEMVIDAPQGLVNSGVIDVRGPSYSYRVGNLSVLGALTNTGVVRVAGEGQIIVEGDLENSGVFTLDEASRGDFFGDLLSGTVTVRGGSIAYVYGAFQGGSMVVDGAGSQLDYLARYSFADLPDAHVLNGGEVVLDGVLDNNGSTYDLGQPDPLPAGFRLGEYLTVEGGSVLHSEGLIHGAVRGVQLDGVALDGGLDLSAGGVYAVIGAGTTFPDGSTFRVGRDGMTNGTASGLYFDRPEPVTFVGATLAFADSLFPSTVRNLQPTEITLDRDTVASGAMEFIDQSGGASTLTNQGRVTVSFSSDRFNLNFGGGYASLVNEGSITARDIPQSALLMNPFAFHNRAGGSLTADGAEILLGPFVMDNAGTVESVRGGKLDFYTDFENAGRFVVDDASFAAFGSAIFIGAYGFQQTGADARTTIDGTLSFEEEGTLTLGTGVAGDGGLLEGRGTIEGTVHNVSGAVAPGDPVILTITGDYIQDSGGVTAFDIEGLGGPGAFDGNDEIVVGGDLTLDGTIRLTTGMGYAGGTVTLFTYGGALSLAGTLSVVDPSHPAWQFQLVAGPGNTVQLQSVPEPAAWLAMAGGLTVLARRRKARVR